MTTTDAPTRRTSNRRVFHVIRRAHLYLGLFLFPWAVLYGVTGFLFNHPTAFADQPTATFGPEAIADTPLGSLSAPAAVAEQVVAKLNERAEEGRSYQLAKPAEARYRPRSFAFATAITADGRRISLLFDIVNGSGTVREQPVPAPPAKSAPAPFAVTGQGPAASRREPAPDSLAAPRPGSGLAVDNPIHDCIKAAVPAVLVNTGFAAATEITVTSVPDLTFQMTDETGNAWRVSYNSLSGSVSGTPTAETVSGEPMSIRRFLTRLHLAHGYPADGGPHWWWAVLVDMMAFVMVFWGVSGLLMWWQLRATRWVGVPVILVSVAAATALAMGMHSVLTGG